ncbi:MAG: hypothetical protein H0T42_33640 [Deltaproteobacteria bacterium]|nr:hypothetical protein [Deltaproteobacteria bacterium]
MSVIIYGIKDYGRVDEHGGEYATTQFFHIWFAPLIPTGSTWVVGSGNEGQLGLPIKLHWKSVAAGYLRVWGAVAAIGGALAGMQTGRIGLLALAAIAGALWAWSWSWRTLRTDAARRRSDFNFVAFGMRCDARRMPGGLRVEAKRDLDRRWNARKPDLTPNDVARHGAHDPGEAVIAYGLLRIAAIERGSAGKGEDADAERILEGAHVAAEVGEGPYRASAVAPGAPTAATLGDLVAARTAEQLAANPSLIVTPADVARAAKKRVRKQRLGLAALTLVGVGGLASFMSAHRPTLHPTLAELRSSNPPVGRNVRITCDSVEMVWEQTDGRDNDVTSRIAMCQLGRYLVPVQFDDEGAIPPHDVEGTLFFMLETELWVKDGLRKDPTLDNSSLDVYVDVEHGEDRVASYIGLLFALATPVAWVLYFRSRRRAKRAAAELATSS